MGDATTAAAVYDRPWRGILHSVDMERTIQFILESQAKAEVRAAKTDARIDAMEKRFDRKIDAITKLLHQGKRMLVKTETRLAELKALIRSLRNGRNGG